MVLDLSKVSADYYARMLKEAESFDDPLQALNMLCNLGFDQFSRDPSASLNLNLFCTDPTFREGVKEVFDQVRRTPACKSSNAIKLERALNVVLANLLLAHFAPEYCVLRVPRSKDAYRQIERYNPMLIGYRPTISAVDGLFISGFTLERPGKYFPDDGDQYQSRIRATAKLWELMINDLSIGPESFNEVDYGETIFLKDENKKIICYNESEQTKRMRETLNRYNQLLLKSDIRLDNTHSSGSRGTLTNRYHRVFNNGSFKLGGRFYGPWWQSISGNRRKTLLINGNPTVELDYSAMHIHLLYGMEGLNYHKVFSEDDDPYTLPGYGEYERTVLKYGILIALNAPSKKKATNAIRHKLKEEGLYEKGMNLDEILERFREKHAAISEYLYSGIGLQTQYKDSCVAEYVIKRLTSKGITCLCIHDSFIVERQHEKQLKELMIKGFKSTGLKSIPRIKVS